MKIKNFIWAMVLSVCLMGCFTPKPAPLKTKEQTRVELVEKQIDKIDQKLDDKAKAFVYGAKYSLSHETNYTVPVVVSERFLDLATLTLGNPSISDAKTIKDIADGLLLESQLETAQAKRDASVSKEQLKIITKDIDNYKKQIEISENKLKLFEAGVAQIQKEKDGKISELEVKNEKLQEKASADAAKAAEWDSENSFLASLNPFTDLWKFAKKLFTLSIIGGVLYLIFHILEIAFPGLSIVSTISGWFIRMISRLSPKAKNVAGLVSASVFTGLKSVVGAIDQTFDKLKNHPIEQNIISQYPDDKLFSKKEVLGLLEDHSKQIEDILRNELKDKTSEADRGIISAAKISAGITKEAPSVQI